MWSLLKRDGLGTQYLALTALWNWLAGANPLRMRDPLTKYLSIVRPICSVVFPPPYSLVFVKDRLRRHSIIAYR